MGSERFPGKVLMELGGRVVLEWVVQRLARATTLSSVVVATSTLAENDPIADLCRRRDWPLFRGSEEDVLDRYFQAAQCYPSEVVVRVTADCPLIDPALVDEVVRAVNAAPRVDYASNVLEPRTYPRGLDVEAFTVQALAEAWQLDKSGWREHVTPFIYRNPQRFRLRGVVNEVDLSEYRWTIDTRADLAAVRALVQHVPDPEASWHDYVTGIRHAPHLADINRGVVQKSVSE